VIIKTFHGFCNGVIANYPEDFPRITGSRHITEAEQIGLIEQLLEKVDLDLLRPFGDPVLYVRPILSAINNLKREGVTVENFHQAVAREVEALAAAPDKYHEKGAHKGKVKVVYQKLEKQISKNQELAKLYEAYEAELRRQKLFDYNDMIMEVLAALQANPVLLQILQEEHQYLLVDEHQDTNNAQNRVLELLANFHPNPNLFVVGDEKQAIFRFQGASLENFLYFKKLYPEAKLVNLVANYRSQQTILDSAESLLPSREPLQAAGRHAVAPIKFGAFPSEDAELFFVASDIKAKIAAGTKPSELAVLYRDNRDAFPLARWLTKLGVTHIIESDEDLLTTSVVKRLWWVLQALIDFGNDELLARVLHLDWFKIDPLLVYELIREAWVNQTTLYKQLQASEQPAFKAFTAKWWQWREWVINLEPLPALEKIIRETGLLNKLELEQFAVINRFYAELVAVVTSQPEATLADFLQHLATMQKHGLLLKQSRESLPDLGRVRLMTVHRAKGLEFDQVYVIGAAHGHFGGRADRSPLKLLPRALALVESQSDEEDEADTSDERRLFYVALTRARHGVTITYATRNNSGRDQLPSVFISEIKPELRQDIDTKFWADKFNSEAPDLLFAGTDMDHTSEDNTRVRELVQKLFRSQSFSVSALNNYLTCPWQYFYCNLLRLPEAPSKPQVYGQAVHEALSSFFRTQAQNEKKLSVKNLLAAFTRELERQPVRAAMREEILARGTEALTAWYKAYLQRSAQPARVLTEFQISEIPLTPGIQLTGKLDKIEFFDNSNTVRVVDYKTRKPMSRKEIMGETKEANGNYYRQLVFYQLLLNNYQDAKYQMRSGAIDFIEPDLKGRHVIEEFTITDQEVAALTEQIKQVADEILNLKLWDKRCDNKECKYCALRSISYPATSRPDQSRGGVPDLRQ
jgi:DNA helicase-2/ATP-dependent DNA helicase PcrA